MKKDKNWLKETLKKRMDYWVLNLAGGDYGRGRSDETRELLKAIDQLDEPEITEEQAWNKIAESYPADVRSLVTSFQHFYYENFIINPTISKKETVEIPQFVNKWLKKRKKDFKTAHDAILYIHSYGWDDETHIEFKLYKWIPDNLELFVRAWNDICTIEKEPQWVVKLDDGRYVDNFVEFAVGVQIDITSKLDCTAPIRFKDKSKAEAVALLVNGDVVEVTE